MSDLARMFAAVGPEDDAAYDPSAGYIAELERSLTREVERCAVVRPRPLFTRIDRETQMHHFDARQIGVL